MRTNLFYLLVVLIVIALVIGCGGRQKESNTDKLLAGMDDDVDLVSDLTGIDEETPVAVEEEPDQERPSDYTPETATDEEGSSIGGSQGVFLGKLMISSQEVSGTFTVKMATAAGDVVMENVTTGSEISLNPGLYDFIFTTKEVLGNPELTLRDVEIVAGRRIKRDVKMPVGKITLVTGKKCAKKSIKIRQKGATDWYPGKFYTCVQMQLMAGEYEAELGGKKSGTPISGIQVYDGGIRDILIRHQ